MTAIVPLAAAAPRPVRQIGRVNWRGVGTVLRRDLTVHLRFWPVTIAGPPLSTLMYFLAFSLALGPARHSTAGAAVLPFLGPALVLLAMLQRAAETCTFSLMLKKQEGSIADLLGAPLAAPEITAAHALAGMIAGLNSGLTTGAVLLLLVDPGSPGGIARPGLLLAFALGTTLMMALFGLLVGLWAKTWDHVSAVFGFVVVPVAFLSGAFAPIEALPAPLRPVLQFNPFFYAIDGFRAGFTGVHSVPPGLSLAVVAAVSAALWLLCERLIATGYRLKP